MHLAAIWPRYLPLSIYITFFNFVFAHPFLFFLSFSSFFSFKKKTNLVSINQTEWSTISACPSLLRSLNGSNIEGTISSKMCLMFVHGFMFYVCKVTGFLD